MIGPERWEMGITNGQMGIAFYIRSSPEEPRKPYDLMPLVILMHILLMNILLRDLGVDGTP